jgi:hypothetical protein
VNSRDRVTLEEFKRCEAKLLEDFRERCREFAECVTIADAVKTVPAVAFVSVDDETGRIHLTIALPNQHLIDFALTFEPAPVISILEGERECVGIASLGMSGERFRRWIVDAFMREGLPDTPGPRPVPPAPVPAPSPAAANAATGGSLWATVRRREGTAPDTTILELTLVPKWDER